jgi:hypothetical protein
MTVPPRPSFPLTKPFAAQARGSAELHDSGSVGLKRDPAGPFGTPTCATEKRQKSEWLRPTRKIAVPLGFWLNHALLRLGEGRGRAQ